MYPDDFRYTKDHEWAELDGHLVRVGVTNHAQEQLGDVVFVELPKVGDTFKQHEPFGTIESVKAVSEIYCPVSGEVVEVNEALNDEPELIDKDPHGAGWMIVLTLSDSLELEALMTVEKYEKYLEEGEDEEWDEEEDELEEEEEEEEAEEGEEHFDEEEEDSFSEEEGGGEEDDEGDEEKPQAKK